MILGIDIGGTKTKLGTLEQEKLVELTTFPTPQDPDEAVSTIEAAVREHAPASGPESIGIGCPGPLSRKRGVVLSPPNLRRWDDFPLVDELTKLFHVPVVLENDGNVGALGEALCGSGKGYTTVFYCTISTGIGIGIVINGTIHQGYNGLAGETWSFVPNNYFGSGVGDNVLDLSAGNGIVRIMERELNRGRESTVPKDEVTTRTILTAYEDGDVLASEVMKRAQDTLGGMVVNAVTLLAPDIVVLAGGLCTKPDWYVGPIVRRVRSWMPIPGLADIPIKRAELWDSAVLYGAVKMMQQ